MKSEVTYLRLRCVSFLCLQKPAAKRARRNSTLSATKDDATDEEEDFDEGTPPPSDDSGDEVSVVRRLDVNRG